MKFFAQQQHWRFEHSFSSKFFEFLEGRRVFFGDGGAVNAVNSAPNTNPDTDRTVPVWDIYGEQARLATLQSQQERMGLMEKSTPISSRGSNSLEMTKETAAALRFSSPKNSEGFAAGGHFEALILDDADKKEGKPVDEKDIAQGLEKPKSVLQPDKDQKSVGNPNINLWLYDASSAENAENSFAKGKELVEKKKEVLKKNILEELLTIDFSKIKTNDADIKKFQEYRKNTSIFFDSQNAESLQKIYVSTLVLGEGNLLSAEEKTEILRIENILRKVMDYQFLQSPQMNFILSQPNAISWNTETEKAAEKISQLKKEIKLLEDAPTGRDNQKITVKKVELQILQDEQAMRSSFRSEYDALFPHEKAYNIFFDKEGKINPNNAMNKLGNYYEWIEKTVFVSGTYLPESDFLQAHLMGSLYRGEIPVEGFRTAIAKMVGANAQHMNGYAMETTNDGELYKFYAALGKVMGDKGSGVTKIQKFDTEMQKFSAYFSDKKDFEKLRSVVVSWGTEKQGEQIPHTERPMQGETLEQGFSGKYGISPAILFARWKQAGIRQFDAADPSGNLPLAQTLFPVETWFDAETGQKFLPTDTKNFAKYLQQSMSPTDNNGNLIQPNGVVSQILAGKFDANNQEHLDFIREFRDYAIRRQTADTNLHFNAATDGKAFVEEIKQSYSGGKIAEVAGHALDEILEGNPAYVGVGIAAFFFLRKSSKLRNAFFAAGGALAMNEVVRDMTGKDWLQEGLELIAGNNEAQKTNSASWQMTEMKRDKCLDETEFSYDDMERASSLMKEDDLADVLKWYDGVTIRENLGKNDPDHKEKIYSADLPPVLGKNIGRILQGKDKNDKEKAGHAAYTFLNQFFKHKDTLNRHVPASHAVAAEGRKYIEDKYAAQLNNPPGNPAEPIRLEHVFNLETSVETREYLLRDEAPIRTIFGEYTDTAYNFLAHHLSAEFGTMPEILNKMRDIKNWAIGQGLQLKISAENELQFWDGTKAVYTVVAKTVGEGAEATKNFVLQDAAGGFLGLNGGAGYASFEEAGLALEKFVMEQVPAFVKTQYTEAHKSWVAFMNNIPLEKLDDPLASGENIKDAKGQEVKDANGDIVGNTDILNTIENLGIMKEIGATYGIEEQMVRPIVDIASQSPMLRKSLQDIANTRVKNANEYYNISTMGDATITQGDVLTYFFGGMYGLGQLVQGGIDTAKAGANFMYQNAGTVAGAGMGAVAAPMVGQSPVAGAVVGGGVGMMFNESAKNAIAGFSSLDAFTVFWRDNIDGKSDFRTLANKVSKNSLENTVDPAVLPAPDADGYRLENLGLNTLWTNEVLHTKMMTNWETMYLKIRAKAGAKKTMDRTTVYNRFSLELQNNISIHAWRSKFLAEASNIKLDGVDTKGIYLPTAKQVEKQLEIEIQKWLKDHNTELEIISPLPVPIP